MNERPTALDAMNLTPDQIKSMSQTEYATWRPAMLELEAAERLLMRGVMLSPKADNEVSAEAYDALRKTVLQETRWPRPGALEAARNLWQGQFPAEAGWLLAVLQNVLSLMDKKPEEEQGGAVFVVAKEVFAFVGMYVAYSTTTGDPLTVNPPRATLAEIREHTAQGHQIYRLVPVPATEVDPVRFVVKQDESRPGVFYVQDTFDMTEPIQDISALSVARKVVNLLNELAAKKS